ncbi:CpsD/CapB family tyrosine-protein kinase [Thermoclostridium caenicola]|uniref:non-specific protein-tyrosine kinase n=1 Tax=Thermoclostridium caenicola TaxID=659425 RepID=A0A1M6J321_9FIRM|nr:CpsD/CapB family tyrosine-protein kinase [Thermoclostridium caenicola]SHJ41113.1 capsular exopolysaccharide family [Thermoclostridium caenicola]
MAEKNTIIVHSNPKSPVSEAYRVLRTNIQYSGIDKPLKSILVTSSVPMEGKTTTVTNLAITFAQAGSKVLLIDGDLRKPKIHKVFMVSNDTGLTNYLVSREDYKEYVRHSDVPNLDIMTSGTIPPNPSELLNSDAMKMFIKSLSDDYDVILLDAPPVCSVTDASIISTYADATILVVNSGKTHIDEAKKAKELLERVNANIIGVVLNKVNKKEKGNYYYYKYYQE